MRVYSGWVFRRHDWPEVKGRDQVHAVIAARSQKAVVERLNEFGANMTLYSLRMYWNASASPAEKEIALASPGTLFIRGLDDYHGELLPVNDR